MTLKAELAPEMGRDNTIFGSNGKELSRSVLATVAAGGTGMGVQSSHWN